MQSNTTATFGARYNPKFTMTYNVPDRNPSGETVNKIFMRVASGRFFDIKKAIIQERSSLGLSDATGRTILHYILLNEELSKSDKYELIKQVIDMGASIDNPDNTGVRPLHIASGQQNRKVVKLLLAKKAEVNSRDNNHLTPLHYAVLPETTTCPSLVKKNLIPDTEAITSDFRTDDLFNKIFDYFKADPNVQMYISHIASIFKNRYVYSDPDEDQKSLAKLVKDTIGERSDISASESIKAKLIDYKKSLYTKTRTDFGKTFSKLDIKENSVNGWAPDYAGSKNKQNAILPFPNLRYEFNSIYDSLIKANTSTTGNLLAQVAKVRKFVTDTQQYVMDTNELMNTFFDCYNTLRTYDNQIFAKDPKSRTLYASLHTLFNGCYVGAGAPTPDFSGQNLNNVLVARNTKFGQLKATSNAFNIGRFQTGGTGPLRIGVGNVLMMYVDNIENLLNDIDTMMQDTASKLNRGLALDSQLDVVTNIGNAQIKLINICYILLNFEVYAKHLSAIIEQFKTSLVDNDITQTLELVSRFINDVIDAHGKIPFTSLRIATHDTGTGGWQTLPAPLISTRTKDDLYAYSYIFNNGGLDQFVIVRSDTIPTPYVDGNYVVDQRTHNVLGYITDLSNYVIDVSKGDVSQIVNKLNKLIEAGGLGRDGKMTDSHRVSNIYSSLYDLQDKINAMINVHNMINGFIFSNSFNNKMVDDSYRFPQTDILGADMVSRMKKLKQIPDTYKRFYDTIAPILRRGGTYSPANALESIKNLINTYGYTLSASNHIFIIRASSQPVPAGKVVHNNPQVNGVISTLFLPTSLVTQGADGIKQGYVHLYAGDIQNNKADDLSTELSIISSVFDSHIYLIKLILIMYAVQHMATLYDAGSRGIALSPGELALYASMKKMLDQIDDINNKNPLGILFAIIGKMIDDIVLSTIDSMSSISASNYIQFLAKDQVIQDRPLSSLLGDSVNPMDKQQLITKPDDRVRLKDSDMLSSVVTSGAAGMTSTDILKFFSRDSEIDTSDTNTDFNRLIDFDSVEKNTDMCYQIDEDLIGDLLDAGADPNMSERTGETALSLGVFLQNEKIVDTLLRSKAKVVFRNTFDTTMPTKNIYNTCYEQLLNSIRGSPIMNIEDIETRVENHLVKKSGMTKTFTNSKLILKMVAYMFTHQLTSTANGYPNMWTREKHNKILGMLNLNSVKQDLIPLATMDSSLIEETVSGYATFRDTMDVLANRLTKEREIFIRLDNSLKNLNLELRELGADDAYRRAEVTQMINELTQQVATIQGAIGKTTTEITALNRAIQANPNTGQATLTKQNVQASNTMFSLLGATSSRDICNVYDIFFKRIISTGLDVSNSEYTTYIQCWSALMARPEEDYKRDQTQTISILMKYISDTGIVKPDIFLDAYSPVCDLYDTVLGRYGRDYTELMPYLGKDGESHYDQNYVLKQIYCIMYHVFKHTMSINFINTIAQLLARRDRGRSEASIMRNIYQAMKSSEFIKHCVEVVPRQVIKITCKIAAAEKDPDMTLTVTDVLNKALDRLSMGTFESVDKASIDLAKEMVVPFFVTYMEAYTAEMHLLMVKQLKMMIVQSRWLSMLRLLAGKAVRESE